MKPDAIIKIRLKTTADGGRQSAIAIAKHPFGCPLFVSGEAFDCRFLIEDRTLELGGTYEVPIKFLHPDLALPKLSVGTPVTLWEGRDIATGKVLSLEEDAGNV